MTLLAPPPAPALAPPAASDTVGELRVAHRHGAVDGPH
ncbi:hypothetical protein C7S17_0118 [Burkholderia thailandensis]|nr:hypothetical protein [Burkholderia thailandensis]